MRRKDIVFFDIDSQFDFIDPEGKLYFEGAEKIIDNLYRLTAFASEEGILIVSTQDTHVPDDPEFKEYGDHCVVGTSGHEKLSGTLLANRLVIKDVPDAVLPSDLASLDQIIFEKSNTDIFKSHHLYRFLENLPVQQVAIYGVALDICIDFAIDGTNKMGKKFILISDATEALDKEAGLRVLDKIKNLGGQIMTTNEFIANLQR